MQKNCSLCGANGVTKVTCPINPNARNPKPRKHLNHTGGIKRKIDPKDKEMADSLGCLNSLIFVDLNTKK